MFSFSMDSLLTKQALIERLGELPIKGVLKIERNFKETTKDKYKEQGTNLSRYVW